MAGVWIFAAVLSLWCSFIFGQSINIALGKPAYQKTTYTGDSHKTWGAANAVDGNFRNTTDGNTQYAHTKDTGAQWWIVDLLNEFMICKIIIHGRADQEARADVSVYIGTDAVLTNVLKEGQEIDFKGNPMWTKTASLKNELDQTVTINPRRKVRFVALTRTGIINLAEVEVFQQDFNPNLALSKPATQKTTYGSEKAEKAVDGSFTDHTSTNSGEAFPQQWWIVDLQGVYTISEIYIRFRGAGHRAYGSSIYISAVNPHIAENKTIDLSSDDWFRVKKLADKFEHTVTLRPSRQAQYVAVVRDGIISLIEVEVYQKPFRTNPNIAFGKPAYQISTYEDVFEGNKYIWSASRAVDGILYDKDDRAYAHTNGPASENQWWMVDLEDVYAITDVYLHGRLSQYQRSEGIKIYLGIDDKHISPEDGTHIDFTDRSLWEEMASFVEGFGFVGVVHLDFPKQARYVAVRNEGQAKIINLKEVQVYQKARRDLISAVGSSMRCESGGTTSVSESLRPCTLIVNGDYWEITLNHPILFGFASVKIDNLSYLQGLQYMYSSNNQDQLRICQVWNEDQDLDQWKTGKTMHAVSHLLKTVVCEKNITPIMKKFRIQFIEGPPIELTGVRLYATEVEEDITSSVLSADYEELEIHVDPFNQIPYVYNAYPNRHCRYKLYSSTVDEYKAGKVLGTANTFSISNLFPGTEYIFRITCIIGGIELPGLSKDITAQTKMCPAFITELPPPVFEHSYFITNYKKNITGIRLTVNVKVNTTNSEVRLCHKGVTHDVIVIQTNPKHEYLKKLNQGSHTATFDQIMPFSDTSIKVISHAADNQTSYSRTSSISPQIEPADGPVISTLKTNSSCIKLKLQPPSRPNGEITSYQLECDSIVNKSFPASSTDVWLCDLRPCCKVKCSARAQNGAGYSPRSNQYQEYTELQARSKDVAIFSGVNFEFGFPIVPIYLPQFDRPENLLSMNYVIIVLQKDKEANQKMNYTQCGKIATAEMRCYIAAQLPESDVMNTSRRFNVGDGQIHNGHFNQVLKEGSEYTVTLAMEILFRDNFQKLMTIAESSMKISRTIFNTRIPLSITTTDKTTYASMDASIATSADYKLFAGVTAAGAVLVIVAVTVSAALILRRVKHKKSKHSKSEVYEQPSAITDQEEHTYNSFEMSGYGRSLPALPPNSASQNSG